MTSHEPTIEGERTGVPAERRPRQKRRRADGEQTYRTILLTAARLASVEGLEGLSIGRLAEEIGMSKSGLYAHFGSKEELQIGTVETAREIFIDEVINPALSDDARDNRLLAACEAFLTYVERRVFPGGCFFVAAAAEVNAHPGPVRDLVAESQGSWLGFLERMAEREKRQGHLSADVDTAQLAFELHAMLVAANTSMLLHGDTVGIDRARSAIRSRLRLAA
ncbi:MAG: TetR/AcrR family transcriptional regulator [Nitrolancea sp.]